MRAAARKKGQTLCARPIKKLYKEENMTWFNRQSRIVQLILLLIPVVNWIVEIVVRWSTFLKKGGLIRLIVCILVTIPSGIAFGWLDFIWVLLFKKLFLQ